MWLLKQMVFVYYTNRTSGRGVAYSLKEMVLCPLFIVFEDVRPDYPNDKRWLFKL